MRLLLSFVAVQIIALSAEAQTSFNGFFQRSISLNVLAGDVTTVGASDGIGAAARFFQPYGVAVDGAGNVYVADSYNQTIRRITPSGAVTTVAGTAGISGSTNGSRAAARFYEPRGLAVDGSGNIFVADTNNHTIRKITTAGVVSTFAGAAGSYGSTDGTGSSARFSSPGGIAADNSGNLFVADTDNSTIRKITATGVVTTLAGTAGSNGSTDGTGAAASFTNPMGLTVDSLGNVYVADTFNQTIRKITSAGVVTTLAGMAATTGTADGTGTAARFAYPFGIGVDSLGNTFVADSESNTIRKVTPSGVVTTVAGASSAGSIDGAGAAARFSTPVGIAIDSADNLYIADYNNSVIRKVTPGGFVTTFAGGSAKFGSADGPSSSARFLPPSGIAIDGTGNAYVADPQNSTIRKIDSTGMVSTLAGSAGMSGAANGTGSSARFNYPSGIAVDGSGNVFVADSMNSTIRKITSAGVVTTVAGTAGSAGSANGTGAAARFNAPNAIAVDGSGNLYVADTTNCTIRKITSAGVVTTLAGTAGSTGSANGTGAAARFKYPNGVAVDGSGNVYVADSNNRTIRKITSGGVVTTLAGTAGSTGSTNGTGAAARFNFPSGVAVDGSGNVYVADTNNSMIRKITASGVVTTLAGVAGKSQNLLGPIPSMIASPTSIAVDSANIYFTTSNGIIKFLNP